MFKMCFLGFTAFENSLDAPPWVLNEVFNMVAELQGWRLMMVDS
jgi:hypothetical protein